MKQQWIFDNNAFLRLCDLVNTISPSMNENAMGCRLRSIWSDVCCDVKTDVMGNVHATLESGNVFNLGIIAHMDSVAVQITNILPNGQLQMRHIGLRPHTLLGQSMKVLTKEGVIEGVVGFDPTSQYGQPKGLIDEDLWMDIGASDYDQACKMVEPGDLAVLTPRITEMGDGNICGAALDDRIGLFIMNECFSWFARHSVPVNLHFIGTVQEEVGLRGAGVIAANTPLDACIVLDVDYATDTPASHINQMGSLKLGKGVGLHIKSDNNPVLRGICKEVAEREHIPYQLSLGRFIYGGTDGSSIQIQQSGIAVANLNIPCRYMHSPVEMCNKYDVESAVRLLIAVITEIAEKELYTFIPGVD